MMTEIVNAPTPRKAGGGVGGWLAEQCHGHTQHPDLVTSYLTKDLNTGLPLVVNMTDFGSQFAHGYTARMVKDGVAHTYGEGNSVWQSKAMFGVLSRWGHKY